MNQYSVTISAGFGSEIHNHNKAYRENEKGYSKDKDIIELVDTTLSYQDKINLWLKPFIDKYNAAVKERYKTAWKRYNKGELKTKPRKRDYKELDCNYYEKIKNTDVFNQSKKETEKRNPFRSLIIGIGDQADRVNKNITEEQAINVFTGVVETFKKDFPAFKILGATIHLDEEGFYHMHLDYFPMYEKKSKNQKGLAVGFGYDEAMKQMGFKPEQSIINGRDKIPILFNAMRNKIYGELENEMNKNGLLMQYHASQKKDPKKDSSKNQKLEEWQQTQDDIKSMQSVKNQMIYNFAAGDGDVRIKNFDELITNFAEGLKIMDEAETSTIRKCKIIKYNRFEQLKSIWNGFISFLNAIKTTFKKLTNQIKQLTAEKENIENKYDDLSYEKSNLEEEYKNYQENHKFSNDEFNSVVNDRNNKELALKIVSEDLQEQYPKIARDIYQNQSDEVLDTINESQNNWYVADDGYFHRDKNHQEKEQKKIIDDEMEM